MKRVMYNQYVSKKSEQVTAPLLYSLLKKYEKHRYQAILELLDMTDNLSCLDIGCGAGDFLYKAQDHFKLVVGTDVLPEQTLKAQQLSFSVPAKFFPLDISEEKIPFKSKSFDLVVSIATLQYVVDLDHAFSEIHRVLKPGGNFIYEVPNFLVIWRRLQLLLGEFPSTSLYQEEWNGGVINYFSESKLRKFCRTHGFTVREVTTSGILSDIRKLWPSVLGANLIFVCKKLP